MTSWSRLAARNSLTGLAVAVASSQACCYNYMPLGRAQLSPSSHVSVGLTQSGSEELARYLGPNVRVVRGRFLSATERGLVIAVSAVETRRGDVLEWKGESVTVPGEFVQSVEERRAATGKTVLLAGASLAGFFAAYSAFGPGATGTTGAGGGQGGSAH